MSTEQFRDLIVGRGFNADLHPNHILAARCDWIACPTCDGEGVEFLGDDDDIGDACPDCDGTGHPTVAQVLAWGEAVATAPHVPGSGGLVPASWAEGYNARLTDIRAVQP